MSKGVVAVGPDLVSAILRTAYFDTSTLAAYNPSGSNLYLSDDALLASSTYSRPIKEGLSHWMILRYSRGHLDNPGEYIC